jgi:pimeloyl-ACP methyl ester carboxylesterase
MLKPILLAAALAAVAAPAFAAPVETFVEILGGPGPLKATMLAPAGGAKAPAIVILPGSGPTDRDGNNVLGVKGATYRLLAEALAAAGVTTLRMDKRGMYASAAAAADANAVTVADLAVDANAWAARLKAESEAECVWLLGHSEGGLVALLAARDNGELCGLILVSTGGRNYGEVLWEQIDRNPHNPPDIREGAARAIAALKAGQRVDPATLPPPLAQQLFHPAIQGFLIEAFRHDPAKLAAAYGKPILIVQGESDLQITLEDAERLKAAQPKAKLVLLPNVNHPLKTVSDPAANRASYADPSLPIAPGVVEAIAGFVKAQAGTN